MKTLLQKNTSYLLKWLPIVLASCCVVFYILMRMQAHHMQERQLQLKQSNVWSIFLKRNGNIERAIPGEYDIVDVLSNASPVSSETRDTTVSISKGAPLPFQVLSGKFALKQKNFVVTTYVSSTEISHLIIKVFITETVILLLLLFSIVILNKKSSRLLWQPFFHTLKQVSQYDIVNNQSVNLPVKTNTIEFDELNEVFNDLIHKVNTAYHNQKQFVENASHEMQTPLAIVRSKLELLINQAGLTESAAAQLHDITEANDRLSQMNRTLLLLAKIENKQFPNNETIDFSVLLRKDLSVLKNHYDDNFPRLSVNVTEGIMLNANHSLLEILIHNLINNAVEHNVPGGRISINLRPESFIIENTGAPLREPADSYFERFKKGSHKTRTTGLGLALVKQICLLYNYTVNYYYGDGLHKIEIQFC